jgi:predicted permease
MLELAGDLKRACRRLWDTPSFTVIAVGTLALGIAATSAIFTVVEAVILRPLPYRDPEQLVRITSDFEKLGVPDVGLSASELFDYRDRSDVFDEVAAIWPITANLTGTTRPERVETILADINYFSLLGARPEIGRLFGPQDYQTGISPVVVISDGLWRRGFGGDPNVLGRTLRIDNDAYQVIGVVSKDFRHPSLTLETDAEVWAPSGWKTAPFAAPRHSLRFLPGAIGRLKHGVTIEQARARLEAMGAELRHEFADDYPARLGWVPRVLPLKQDLIASSATALVIVMGAVLMVLVICCANIANLQLARGAARQREMAIRRALGASSGRIAREQLIESAVVAAVGGGLGLLLTLWALDGLMQLAPESLPRRAEVGLNWTVALFALASALVTGLVFGLAPALQAARASIQGVLKDGSRSATPESARMRRGLIVAEFALALVLLVGGTLLVRSFWQLQHVDPGFNSDRVTMARLWLPQPNDPATGPYFTQAARARFFRDYLAELGPLSEHVGISTVLPLTTANRFFSFTVEGWLEESTEVATARASFVAGEYFATLGIPLVRGRLPVEQDDEQHPRAVVINETMARTYWANQDAIGKRFRQVVRPGSQPPGAPPIPWITVVGIVGDVHSDGLDRPVPPEMYGSMWQQSSLAIAVVVKPRPGQNATDLLTSAAQRVDPDLPLYAVRPLESLIERQNASRRFAMLLVGLFGVSALLLAALGIYGVVAHAVSQQRREIGIRLALGAARATVVRMVLLDGLRLTLAGVAIGIAGALALMRLLSGLLFGVSAFDPATFAAIAVLLSAVALAACWVPARRAASVDPLVALRTD